MILSFPRLLVPKTFEKGSIPNVNVCCSLITASGGRRGGETDCDSPLLPAFPLFSLHSNFHISSMSLSSPSLSATRLTPRTRACVCAAVLCGTRKCPCVLVSFEKQPIPYTGNKLPLMLCSHFIFIFSVSCQVLMFLQRLCT